MDIKCILLLDIKRVISIEKCMFPGFLQAVGISRYKKRKEIRQLLLVPKNFFFFIF